MNVGLIQVSSMNSPTSFGVTLGHEIIHNLHRKTVKIAHAMVTSMHLVQEAGGGSGWGTFHSFLSTQVVKELAGLWKNVMSTKL